ncbi:MAG: Z1 domain-containing protein [Salinivirgaceae bacterium]|nr:Z1 domain-containing protein [Salinivirgaceae bacterium]
MEQYRIDYTQTNPINEGKFFARIHQKHVEAYNQKGADNIVKNVRATYSKLMQQLAESANPNSLLVGKVQSGKTSNLELLTALAFDNGYNLLIIYGGYDKELLCQCTERFSLTFDAASENELLDSDMPVVFTTNTVTNQSNTLASLTEDFAKELLEEGRPMIITSLKRPYALNKVNKLVASLISAIPSLKPFIIDDEGDQASLNTAKNKAEEATPTYRNICYMKRVLRDPLYLSVTATPQANIFQEDISKLIPESIHLIQPGEGYDGASVYHLSENEIIQSIAEEDDNIYPESLREAVLYFLIASTIKAMIFEKKKEKKSDMIIHADRAVHAHDKFYSSVDGEIKLIRSAFDNRDHDPDELKYHLNYLKQTHQKFLSAEQRTQYPFDNTFVDNLGIVAHKTGVILQNGKDKITKESEKTKLHKIFIGGDLLQRGLTFPNLLVSYFTRFAKNGGNMDTTLQRARWFGYRNKYLDLCKIFTTDEIAKEFTALADIEDDLWEQFEDVENGVLAIKDIIIKAEDTKQKPTAKNKAKYKKIKFKNRWIKQKFIVIDDTQIATNNANIRRLVSSISDWQTTTQGSVIGLPTGKYAMFSADQMIELIRSIETAFDREPFNKTALLELVGSSEVPVILMGEGLNEIRYRSIFVDAFKDRIKALHQGANTSNTERLTYQGDNKVIVDPDKINIQIHHISPGITRNERLGKDQYMFAIYLPKDKTYFVKDND